jgi:adenine-specific DNA-methyltransferase
MAKKKAPAPRTKSPAAKRQTGEYRHAETAPARPDVGVQPQFKRKLPPKSYRYDSSLSPALDWDGKNSVREQGEALIREIAEAKTLGDAKAAAEKLKAISKPFLNWAGKAERLSFDVPSLPLFVHERLSTKAILETLKGHRREKQLGLFDLFADPQRPIHDQILRAYEYQDQWVNRMILGDSLVVMNSLAQYEGLAGQVQMIYMDPPYGVKFGSNFQPFVRKRDVAHNDDDDMTREPEMVQAYRDTWELGLHSYLTYLRDRLFLSRELLAPSGSIFVQISDENLHHVREVLDEVFGAENACAVITFRKTSGASSPQARVNVIGSVSDYLIWYAKDIERLKYRQLFVSSETGRSFDQAFSWVELPDKTRRPLTADEREGRVQISGRRFSRADLSAQNDNQMYSYDFQGKTYRPSSRGWRTTAEGMERLSRANRLTTSGNTLRFVQYADDFPVSPLQALWSDTGTGSFLEDKLYVVQTNAKVVERCLLMTTDPGDIVVDPTCGSGTTAYVAEEWGRRWITIDTSRVPLALARQRLLTATFPWYELKDEPRGPGGGFVYKRRQNQRGDEVGGIVPHITLKSIANDEPPQEEVLVDRPEEGPASVTRVTGPFVVEATIPTVMDAEGESQVASAPAADGGDFVERMIEILRRSPVLRLEGNRTVTLRNLRRPAKTLSLSAEGVTANGADKPVALVFGPENGAVVERLAYEAAREAAAKNYSHLYVIGFAIQPTAREFVDKCEQVVGIAATYVQATPDLMMGDLLKNMRSSQIFSVCGLPEVEVKKVKRPAHAPTIEKGRKDERWFEVSLLGLDVFDPATMEVVHKAGDDVPAWFLDTDYNGLSFHVCQAFFPRTSAWDNLKRALKGEYEDSVWEHLAGNVSVPFEEGEHAQIGVKVIDDRGNELMVVRNLKDVA